MLGKFWSVTMRQNHKRARERKKYGQPRAKTLGASKGCNYERNKTPRRGCLHTNLGRLFIQEQKEKSELRALKGQFTTSVSAICLPNQPTLPAPAGRAWPSRRRGSHASPPVCVFISAGRLSDPLTCPGIPSHLGNTKALSPPHKVSALYRKDKHFHHQLLRF